MSPSFAVTRVSMASISSAFAVTFWLVAKSCDPFTASVDVASNVPAARPVMVVPPTPSSVIVVWAALSYVTVSPTAAAIDALTWPTVAASVSAVPSRTFVICRSAPKAPTETLLMRSASDPVPKATELVALTVEPVPRAMPLTAVTSASVPSAIAPVAVRPVVAPLPNAIESAVPALATSPSPRPVIWLPPMPIPAGLLRVRPSTVTLHSPGPTIVLLLFSTSTLIGLPATALPTMSPTLMLRGLGRPGSSKVLSGPNNPFKFVCNGVTIPVFTSPNRAVRSDSFRLRPVQTSTTGSVCA